MPLDLRHPTAPHQKLKLPEWYASNLMMDRALDGAEAIRGKAPPKRKATDRSKAG